MRTVSFSDTSVQKLLNDDFVCLRMNTRGDPTAGESFSHAPNDPAGPCLRGNGRQNVQIICMTPSAEIFHVLVGFVGPEDLQSDLKFALATYRKLPAEADDRRVIVRDAHVEFLQTAGFSDAEIERPTSDFGALFANVASSAPAGDPGGSFDRMIEGAARNQVLADHRFAIEHPLLPLAKFKPEMLVGNGKSFFGSTSFGNVPRVFRGQAQRSGD